MNDAPYLSVVATSRNDDHGGGMLERMQLFVSGWLEQCRRHGLAAELVLVEWNPPPNRPPLAEVLEWPADPGPGSVRVITVPEALHRRLRHSDALPLFQMIAKNVGIRRARAPFVLATNVDILFDDELVAFLAARRLEHGRLYRIDRTDAASTPPGVGVAEQLDYCSAHVLRVNEREGTFVGASRAASDAGLAPGLRLGSGLGIDRRPTGEPYLSGCGEVTVFARPPAAGPRVLRMIVEAGPQPVRAPLAFELRDAAGASLVRQPFRSGERLFIPLPAIRQDELELRIAVDSSDPRARRIPLCLRLFDCGWASPDELRFEASAGGGSAAPCAVEDRDVYRYEQGISLHDGWGEREFTADGSVFRVARPGAVFSSYRPTRWPGRLVLDLEAEGDSVREVRIADAGSSIVAHQALERGRSARIFISDTEAVGSESYTVLMGDPGAGGGVRVRAIRRLGLGQGLRSVLRPLARPRIDFLHTNACGDFTLMHRDHWLSLGGYPEWEAYSMNIDGFLCFAAHASGLREVVLRDPMRIYHLEHGLGSGWSPEGEKKLFDRITSRGITWVGKEQVLEEARRMYRQGPRIVNDEGWGLVRETLVETHPTPPARDAAERLVPADTDRKGS